MLRVNFYRPSYMHVGDKNGDKVENKAINLKICDKKSDKFRARILEYLAGHQDSKTQDIALEIGLKVSRTKVYLAELVEEGKIIANGANRNRTYSLR